MEVTDNHSQFTTLKLWQKIMKQFVKVEPLNLEM